MSESPGLSQFGEDAFVFTYPKGTLIFDKIRGASYYTGDSAPSTNIEALAKNARSILPGSSKPTADANPLQREQGVNTKLMLLTVLNIICGLILIGVLWFRRRRPAK